MKFERVINSNQLEVFLPEMKKAAQASKTGTVHVLVETPKRHRTTGVGSQNAHLNGHIQQICEATGNDFSDVKKYVKQMAIPLGYPMLKRRGYPVYDLWGQPMGISERDCSTAECGFLIDSVHRLAAELGIVLKENDGEYWYY